MTHEKVKQVTIASTLIGGLTAGVFEYWIDDNATRRTITQWGTIGALLSGAISYWYSSSQTRKSRYNRALDLMSLSELNKKQLLDLARPLIEQDEDVVTLESTLWKSFISDISLLYSGSRYFLLDAYYQYKQIRQDLYEAHSLLNLAQQAPQSTLPQYTDDELTQQCAFLQKTILEHLKLIDAALVALKKHPGFYMQHQLSYAPIEYHVGVGVSPTDNSTVWVHTYV